MSQSKRQSLLESLVNVLAGYGVAVLSQVVIFPLFGVHVSVSENMLIAGFFTVISIVRSYALRRFFNSRIKARSIDRRGGAK